MSAQLKDKLAETCELFEIDPILDFSSNNNEAISLIPDNTKNKFETSEKRAGLTIPWCPPMPNWNPWSGCNIDEGPLATVLTKHFNNLVYLLIF